MRKWAVLAFLAAACTSSDEPVVVSHAPDGTITMAFKERKCISSAWVSSSKRGELWIAVIADRSKCLDTISTAYDGTAYTIVRKGEWGKTHECLDIYLSTSGVNGQNQICF